MTNTVRAWMVVLGCSLLVGCGGAARRAPKANAPGGIRAEMEARGSVADVVTVLDRLGVSSENPNQRTAEPAPAGALSTQPMMLKLSFDIRQPENPRTPATLSFRGGGATTGESRPPSEAPVGPSDAQNLFTRWVGWAGLIVLAGGVLTIIPWLPWTRFLGIPTWVGPAVVGFGILFGVAGRVLAEMPMWLLALMLFGFVAVAVVSWAHNRGYIKKLLNRTVQGEGTT